MVVVVVVVEVVVVVVVVVVGEYTVTLQPFGWKWPFSIM